MQLIKNFFDNKRKGMRLLLTVFLITVCFAGAFSQGPKLMVPVGHSETLKLIAFSPDGRRIVTAAADHTAKIWEATTGRLLADLKHNNGLEYAEFSPDGRFILTASDDTTATLWNATTGTLVRELNIDPGKTRSARFSLDGTRIVTADGRLRIWNARAGVLLMTVELPDHGFIRYAEYSKDGKLILAIGSDINIVNAVSGKPLMTLKGGDQRLRVSQRYIHDAHFSPDGKKVIAGFEDNATRLFEVASGKLLAEFQDEAPVTSAVFSPDGKLAATISEDAKIYDVDREKLKQVLNASAFGNADFSKDGKLIAFGGFRGASVHRISTGEVIQTFTNSKPITVVKISPESKRLITASEDSTVKVWDISHGKMLADLKGEIKPMIFATYVAGKKIVISESVNSLKMLDPSSVDFLRTFEGYNIAPYLAAVSRDGQKMATISRDQSIIVWDILQGKQLQKIKEHSWLLSSMFFSDDGNRLFTLSDNGKAEIWDITTGELLHSLQHRHGINYAELSPNGNLLVTASSDSTAGIWDVSSGRLLKSLLHNGHVNQARFSPDGKKIITVSWDYKNGAQVWSVESGQKLLSLSGHTDYVSCAAFHPDNETVITGSLDNTIRSWDAKTGIQKNIIQNNTDIYSMSLMDKGSKILTTSVGYQQGIRARLWDLRTGKFLMDVAGANNDVNAISISPDEKTVGVRMFNNSLSLQEFGSGRELFSYFGFDGNSFLIKLPGGEFMASVNAARLLHYVTNDLKVITFEQLDVKYNRPDKVLEAIGNTDTSLIKSYRKAWEKRIKKLGIDTTAFRDGYSVPECDFADRDNIEYEQRNGSLKLRVRGYDSSYKLDRFNIWVNEAPLFGQRGISLKKKNNNNLDTIVTIGLSEGPNRIETSITNVNGTESYRMPLLVNYAPAVKQSVTTHFIGIGIDKFKDSKHDLQYSSKDISDLSIKLKEKYGNSITIDTLFNENVTVSNVKALKSKLMQTSVNDRVIVSYSGHGLLSKDFDYYLSTYNINFEKPEEGGLPYDGLENLLDSIPARKKLMLIDACHSGEVDKEELVRINKASDSLHLTKGGITVAYESDGKLGMKNSFELMQNLFVNVGKSTGATIISAAAGTQFAMERGDLKNGVFTYCILEAMEKNKTMKISELKKIVGQRVEELTNGMQKPTSRNENISTDWTLW